MYVYVYIIYVYIYILQTYYIYIEREIELELYIYILHRDISFTPKLYQFASDLKIFGDELQISCI